MPLPSAEKKIYLLKLAALALFTLAIPFWLLAQHGGEMGRKKEGDASSIQAEVKENELRQSVHQKLDCSTCHGETEMGFNKLDSVSTCARCHEQAFNAFLPSVHADSVTKEMPQAASCVACHGSHEVQAVGNPFSAVSRTRVTEETCAKCHESPTWTETHSIPPNVVADYRQSFHGLSAALGDRRTANCASCHSYHEILPSSNPFSTVSPKNLAQTCAACHAGANAPPMGGVPTFATGGIHYNPEKQFGFKIVDFVKRMYLMMITLTISLMFLHNLIDFWGRLRERLKRRREKLQSVISADKEEIEPPSESDIAVAKKAEITADSKSKTILKFLRFTVNERIQHWTLATSFMTLALTGFALKYTWQIPFLEAEKWVIARGFLHRTAAVVFIVLAVYHVGFMMLTQRGRQNFRSLVPHLRSVKDLVCRCGACLRLGPPSVSDWKNLIQTVKYNLGFAERLPKMGRFTYAEKMEYLALIWGSAVMIVTGLILWFFVPFLNRFQYWVFELATAVHYYEALLATLSIIVWHFYYTIYNPHVFPLSKAMITGEISREEMERDHTLELQTMEEETLNKD
jgi:cytochrome b subunit of formate dehydrogenase